VNHRPEPSARVGYCFANVWDKVKQCGGRARYGWMFIYRINPGLGGYVFATNHAVWQDPNGMVVDVTPFHALEKHHPITQDGAVLFLVDDAAEPVVSDRAVAPLPTRYFPLGNDERLVAYVDELSRKEQQKCDEIYKTHGLKR
jgi:hypothetical protein